MPGRFRNSAEGPPQPSDAIQAFCRHLGELCDVLTAPYDAEALAKAAGSQELQGTNCHVLLHNALYHWLGERLELSLTEDGKPEEAAKRARECALSQIQQQDMLAEFVGAVADTCADATAEVPPERGKHSLLFDLQGPIDLLGPDEIDSLLSELASSDAPVSALEALSSDVHLLEDLCFGPTWPQLCDALGRLVCLPAAAAAAATAGGDSHASPPGESAPATAALPRQQQLLLAVLQELVSSSAASSPPHAAELLDALAPYLTALVLRVAMPSGGGPAAGAAPSLQAAAVALDPFAVGIIRVLHQLLVSLAAEFHMLPPSCAALAARAVCDVVRAGLAHGAPAPSTAARRVDPVEVDLSALDLLVLLDPELRWWQRLCAATHATQPVAAAAAATQMAAALEAALQAWAAAAGGSGSIGGSSSSSSHSHSPGHGTSASLGGDVVAAGGRSATHLVACTALLGGFVRANNLALLALEPVDAGGFERGGVGGGRGSGGGRGDSVDGSAAAVAGRPTATGSSAVAGQQQRVRLQRMLVHLVTCFCAAFDKPWVLRPGGSAEAGSAASAAAAGGSVLLLLAADVLSSAAELGSLPLVPVASAGSRGGGGGGALTALLQAMLRAAAVTASFGNPAAPSGAYSTNVTATCLSGDAINPRAETWLAAAARVLGAAVNYTALAAAEAVPVAAASPPPPPPPGSRKEPLAPAGAAVAEAMCGLLRHVAGRVRGSGAATTRAVPGWATQVVAAAVALAASSQEVAAALRELYDALHEVLSGRAAATATRADERGGSGGGGGGTLSGGPPRMPLLDLFDVGQQGNTPPAAAAERDAASGPMDRTLSAPVLNDLELLAAEAVMSFCRADLSTGTAPATGPFGAAAAIQSAPRVPAAVAANAGDLLPRLVLKLPTALQRHVLLDCAARRLCELYVSAGVSIPAAAGGGGGRNSCGALCVRRTAAKRRLARQAEALANSCPSGQQALLAAGFAQLVLNDVASVLRSGEYESPYLEPLPYADPLAGLGAVLSDLLCWPGLLTPPPAEEEEGGGSGQGRGAADGGGAALTLRQRHRRAVLALLQELVTWLDPRGAEGRGLPPADAAAVSVRAFATLVAAHPDSAGAALERDTNIRWYLQSMCGTRPEEGEDVAGAGHSDMLLDLARGVLRTIRPPTAAVK